MKQIASNLQFENEFGDEERFQLRKWLEDFLYKINLGEDILTEHYFAQNFIASGFSDHFMMRDEFEKFLRNEVWRQGRGVFRWPDLKLSQKNGRVVGSGTYEQFFNGLLIFEGRLSVEIAKDNSNDNFFWKRMAFDARFKVNTTE